MQDTRNLLVETVDLIFVHGHEHVDVHDTCLERDVPLRVESPVSLLRNGMTGVSPSGSPC